VELSLPQRCAAHIASLTDLRESIGVGKAGVALALDGNTGVMATIERVSADGYSVEFGMADIKGIANAIKTVPESYINEAGNGVTEECLGYLAPLVIGENSPRYDHGMPVHVVI